MTQPITHHIYPIACRHPDYLPPSWTGFGTDSFTSGDVSMNILGFSLDRYDVMRVQVHIRPISENAPTITRGLRLIIEQGNDILVKCKELEVTDGNGLDKHVTYAECIAHHLTTPHA